MSVACGLCPLGSEHHPPFFLCRGRYYVHFVDNSYFFYGPPSLGHVLNKRNKKKQLSKAVSVVSVAFGKQLDDFFVVR